MKTDCDVIVVGAGAAGVGVGVTLRDFKVISSGILDRYEIGASLKRWPAEMRLITPSFNSTLYGILDLNAIALQTSVANFLAAEHPTGKQYASYLEAIVRECKLNVQIQVEVQAVESLPGGGFVLTTPQKKVICRFLVWAAGEFQFPKSGDFPGSELCLHNGAIASYSELAGEERIIIGAFKSGIDAAVHLAHRDTEVTVLNAGKTLATTEQDPSRSLSPFTRNRLEGIVRTRRNLHLEHHARVRSVRHAEGRYTVKTEDGRNFTSSFPPILTTGFRAGTGPVEHLFGNREDGEILLTENDESTLAPGLFLAGPLVRHQHHIFCYIYKFRQRFAIVAETIARRLDIPVAPELLQT